MSLKLKIALGVVALYLLYKLWRYSLVAGVPPSVGPSPGDVANGIANRATVDDAIAGVITDEDPDWFLTPPVFSLFYDAGIGLSFGESGQTRQQIAQQIGQRIGWDVIAQRQAQSLDALEYYLVEPAKRCPLSALTVEDFQAMVKCLSAQFTDKDCPIDSGQQQRIDFGNDANDLYTTVSLVGGILSSIGSALGSGNSGSSLLGFAQSEEQQGIADWSKSLVNQLPNAAKVLQLGQFPVSALAPYSTTGQPTGATEPYLNSRGERVWIRDGLFDASRAGTGSSWRYGWVSQELSGTAGLRARVAARARFYRCCDVIACLVYPARVVVSDPEGKQVWSCPPGTYKYTSPRFGRLWGSIFPPNAADGDVELPDEPFDHAGEGFTAGTGDNEKDVSGVGANAIDTIGAIAGSQRLEGAAQIDTVDASAVLALHPMPFPLARRLS